MKKTTDELINETAERAAKEVVRQQRAARSVNHYRTMVRLLYNYPKMRRLANATDDEYGIIPPERSHSITIAPPDGGGVRDQTEILAERIAERQKSHARTKAQYAEVDAVVQQFKDLPEFVVIRMYYFNEDVHGRERGPDQPPRSFAQIVDELAEVGQRHTEKTLRSWRNRLVQDMVVVMFGIDGALSLENPRDNKTKEEAHGSDEK